jgi:L-cystine uptake protein TcyP (sodium:dicarboxylate symporter family)
VGFAVNDFLMRKFLLHLGAVIMLCLVVGSIFGASSYQVVRPDPQALATASKWLSMVDIGNYTQAYAMLPTRIKSAGDVI